MTAVSTSIAVPLATVTARLARLRKTVLLWTAIRGWARWLSLLLALVVLDFALDRTFHFDRPQRAIAGFLVAAVLSLAFFRWLLVPLSRPLGDVSLAWELERLYPSLGQSLVSALELANSATVSRPGISPHLIRRAMNDGAQRAAGIDVHRLIAPAASRRALLACAAAATLLATFAASSLVTPSVPIWFQRNVLLRDVKWPQNTYLIIHQLRPDGSVVMPRGGDWTQLISVSEHSRLVPDSVELEIASPSEHSRRQLELGSQRQYSARFSRIAEPFRFRVRGGDDISPWVQVVLADPPDLTRHLLRITPPSYVGLAEEGLPLSPGPASVLAGSTLHFQATANKSLPYAVLTARGQHLLPAASAEVQHTVSLLTKPGSDLSATISPVELLIGRYQVELRDEFGFTERAPLTFDLRQREDQAPRINLKLLTSRGLVTPRAVVPFECEASDDFGLSHLQMAIRWQSATGEPAGDETVDLGSEVASALVAVGQPSASPDLKLASAIDLTKFAGLTPGSTLQIVVSAADNNSLTGPSTGASPAAVLSVVSDDEMRAELLRREKELRHQLEQATRLQEQLTVDARVLATREAHSPEFAPELDRVRRGQLELSRNLQSIAERYHWVGSELASNRLDDAQETFQTRVSSRIVQPLQQVGSQIVPAALDELRLAQALHSSADAQLRLSAAVQQQTAASTQLREILRHMLQSETYQEAIQMLAEINRAQQVLTDQTSRVREEKVKRLLDDSP